MNKQQGFTLIELVMVIVILGILAVTALPKFADLSSEARIATLQGALGSTKSAMAIIHAQSLIEGEGTAATGSVTVEGSAIATAFGYPTAATIGTAAGLGDFVVAAGVVSVADSSGSAIANCNFTYTAATSATVPASVATPVTTGC